MSFRGRYPSKFRRSGNFRGQGKVIIVEKSRPFRRKNHQDRASASTGRFREIVPIRGRGKPVERGYFSDYGKSRPFRKNFSGRGFRPARSRGRFFRGRQGHFRGDRERRFDSEREYDQERPFEERGLSGEMLDENEFVEDESYFDERADDWYADEEENEYYNRDEERIPFERVIRSPLTIHRRFDGEEFDVSPERSRSLLRQSPSLETRHFTEKREPSYERRRSPVERFGNRRDSIELARPHVESRDHFTGHRRSRSIDERETFVEHGRSNSPSVRVRREEKGKSLKYKRHSLERSRSPRREFRSRERSLHDSDCERSITESSRRSIERQIAFEKKRLQQMLYEKKIHEKRSESSIERYLDGCKRSFENNPKSRSISPTNSYDGRDYHQRKYESPYERSLSPSNHSRKFKGLENITIERGRSIERSNSPVRPLNYKSRNEFSPERQRSPEWREDLRQIRESNSDSRRRSRSPEFQHRQHFSSGNFSPEVSYGRRSPISINSSSRTFRKKSDFLGHTEGVFLDKQRGPFLEDHKRVFLGDPDQPFLEERAFLENRPTQSGGDGGLGSSAQSTRGRSFERLPHVRGFKGTSNFLGVVDGPSTENRPIESKTVYNRFDQKTSDKSMELSPVSQSGSFERREFSAPREIHSNNEMDLSPISKAGSLSHDNKNNRDSSPITPTEDLGSFDNTKVSAYGSNRPASADSMQKFLAELEEDERSRSPGETSLGEGNFKGSNSENKEEVPSNKGKRKESMNLRKFDKFHSAGNSKEITEDSMPKSSYYDFKFNYNSTQDRKHDGFLKTNDQQDKLFNAYEESFISQSCDAYNEDLFQGRYEQSTRTKNKNSLSKTGPPLHLNKAPELNLQDVAQKSQMDPARPPYIHGYNNHFGNILPFMKSNNMVLPNVIPQNPTLLFSGSNIRPQTTSFYPNQAMEPMYSFQQMPSTLPVIPPMPFQQNNRLSNLRTETVQPSTDVVDNTIGKPMYSRQINKISNQQPVIWNNPDLQLQNNPVKFNRESDQLSSWPQNSASQGQLSSNEPSGLKVITNPTVRHNVKDVIVISDDEGQGKKLKDDTEEYVFTTDGIVVPTARVVEKYKNCTPTFDVLGKILKGFVIYFGVKKSSELEKDPIEVLKESFSSSEGFERLNVEETSEYKPNSEHKHICELRWQGILLSRAEAESKEEARHVAGIALINALAKTCFTIQTKYGYYNNGRFPRFMLKHPEKQDYYKMIKRDEIINSVTETVKQLRAKGFTKGVDATHVNAVITFMDEFFKNPETHCELIFGPSSGMDYTIGELQTIARHATDNGLQYRWFHGTKKIKVMGKFVCVSRHFSPQALQRYLLAEMGDTVRYRLFPPQGPQIDLLTSGNFYSPNMIKSIIHMIGPGGNVETDVAMDNSFQEDADFDQPTHSNQSGSRWDCEGYGGNNQSRHNATPQIQSYKQNPNPRPLESAGPFDIDLPFQNPPSQSSRFDQSFQNASPNTFGQQGYKRDVPVDGGRGGKRGKWC